jgi:hypothetical protein
MCCGSRRSVWSNIPTPRRAPPTTPRVTPSAVQMAHVPGVPGPSAATTGLPSSRGLSHSVILHYVETSAIRVWGPVTGRRYEFSSDQTDQPVDPRDAVVLTRSRLFRRA